jgi:polysaccharide chain length determinant protein (PEP-CTERM system associated)
VLSGIAIDANPAQHLDYLRNTLLSRPNLERVIHLANLDAAIGTPASKETLLNGLASDITIRAQASNLYLISYRNHDPVVARDVVQSLLTLFAERTSDNNRAEMDKTQRFLNEEIASYEQQLRAAEQRRAEFHQRYMNILPGAGSNVPRLEATRASVRDLAEQYQDAVSKRDALKSELVSVPQYLAVDSGAAIVIQNGRLPMTATEVRLDDAKKNLDTLRLRFTEQHPDVVAARNQVADLEAQVQKERAGGSGADPGKAYVRKSQVANPVFEQLKVRLVDAEGSVATTKRRLDDARANLAEVEKAALQTPEIDAKAQDLDRGYAIIKRNYEELLQRRQATLLGQAANTRADKITFRIVDPPQVAINPISPNQPLLFSAVLILGLGIGGGLTLLLAQIDRSFSSVSELLELGLPVLGAVAYISSESRRPAYIARAAGFGMTALVLLVVYGGLMAMSTGFYRAVI